MTRTDEAPAGHHRRASVSSRYPRRILCRTRVPVLGSLVSPADHRARRGVCRGAADPEHRQRNPRVLLQNFTPRRTNARANRRLRPLRPR